MAGSDPLVAFPTTQPDRQRVVIQLPEKLRDQESSLKVELVAGKMMLTDGVNKIRLSTAIEAKNLDGWGYTYYQVTAGGPATSTLMAAGPGEHKVEQFVSGAPKMIHYNSRLPIVVYLPEGYQLRYRIWQAKPSYLTAPAG